MIIAKYLNTHKSDDDFNKVIERYFDDQDIRAYYGRMKLFRSTNHSDDAKACNTAMNKIIKKYKGSKDFDTKKKEILSNNYWWVKNSKTSFSKLSECLDDDYAKILYLRACYSTHAGALGDVALLGRPLADGLHLYTGKTYNGAAMSMQLAVSSFYNISDVMFENLEIVNPVSSEEFFALLHTYFKNSDDEVNEQKLYLNTPTQ